MRQICRAYFSRNAGDLRNPRRGGLAAKKTLMIAESFGSRTLANIEAALEWARNAFSTGAEEHGFVVYRQQNPQLRRTRR
jgi:hypothetical protein